MNKYPFVRQEGIKDCGVSCLLMIIKYYKGFIPLDKLRELTNTSRLGVNAYNLCEGAREIGFNAEGLKTDIDHLNNKDVFLPCIAHVVIDNYHHYIVIYRVNFKKKCLIIADPATKVKKISFDEFNKIWNGIVINLYPNKAIPIENNESVISFILKYITPYKKILFSCFIMSILVTIFSSLSALYFRVLIDNINTSKNYLLFILFIFLIVTIIKTLCNLFRNRLMLYLNQKIDINVSCDIYNKIIDLPYQYYHNRTTGEIVSRFNDLNVVKDIITKILLTLFLDLPLGVVCLIILFKINLSLSLILILLMIIYGLVVTIYDRIISKYIAKLQNINAENTSLLVESISGFETLRNLNIINKFKDKYEDKHYNFITRKFACENIINYKSVINEFIFNVGIVLILYLGSICVVDNTFSIGTLIMFYTLSTYCTDSIKNILFLNKDYKEAKNSLRRIIEMFVKDSTQGVVSKFTTGNIEIRRLNYNYNSDTTVIKNVSLNISSGEKVLITGSSGSGKSTLLKIIMKYYQVDNTKVFLDDIDLNFYRNDVVSNSIKYVSQNEILFSDTLLNNLCLGENKDVFEVVKLCEIDKIINKHNINFNYILEENGFNLSGGERQRIILGRALLQDFKILLIDEGLNQMDIDLERRILKRLFKKYKNRTIIIVSHRLDNLDLYDHYIELSHGKIVKDVNRNE